jgi:hypothetical protein
MKRKIIANILEATGALAISGGIETVSRWGGIVAFGAAAILFGVALERATDAE